MSKVDDMLTDAVARTDQEIFAEAMESDEPINDGDTSLEAMGDGLEGNPTETEEPDEGAEVEAGAGEEGETTEEPAEGGEEGADKSAETPAKAEPEEPRDARGLREALKAERTRRQASDTALEAMRAESKATLDAMNARLDRALGALEAKPKPAPKAETAFPDPIVDPDGYRAAVLETARQERVQARVAETFQDAHEAHGKEFEDALAAAQRLDANDPSQRAIGNRIYTSPNPGKALMQWHRQQNALKEYGTDPKAYRDRVAAELLKDPVHLKAAIAAANGQARNPGGGAPARTITRMPPSLNGSRGGAPARAGDDALTSADNTDAAIFDHAMSA